MPSTFLWLPKRRRSQAVVSLDDCGESKGKKSFFSKARRGRRSFSAALGGGASHAQAAEGTSSSLGPEQGILRGQPTLFVDPRRPSSPHSPPPHAHFFASSYDLTRRPSTSFALRSSVDFTPRRPTSVAFAHPQPWSAFAETSEDLFEDDGDYPYQYEENPAQIHRGDFRSRAKLTCQSVLSLVEKTGILSRNLRAEGMKSEVWASSSASGEMTTPPPVPARSRLRTVPTPKLGNISSPTLQSPPSFANNISTDELSTVAAASTRGVTHGQTSLYNEPSSIPSPHTPNLTSPSMPCFATSPSSLPRSPLAQDFPSKGKRRSSKGVERDPYKVKDGVEKKQSSSGVYTPTTYPGPCGPRPSHYPSHVYTPPNFSLHSRRDSGSNPISPSSSVRSSSSDHSDSTAPPGTPITPTGRFGKALTSQAKRLSTMAGLGKGRRDLERDSYFPSTTSSFDSSLSHSRQSSWGHSAQTYHDSPSGYFYPSSQGLGFGIEEELQLHSSPVKSERPQSVATVMGLESGAEIKKTVTPVRGRRKPVPKYEEDEIVEKVKALEV
ncbi:hypothetical protein IAT38_004321 [Cryptococcus sp. DSM 104549]